MEKRAAFQLLDNVNTWFLSGDRYIHFVSNEDRLVRGPYNLPHAWESFKFDDGPDWTGADAFLRDVSAPIDGFVKAFVFKHDLVMYIQVGVNEWWPDQRLREPTLITEQWTALGIAGFASVDAAFLLSDNATSSQAWFFRNNHCVLIEFSCVLSSSLCFLLTANFKANNAEHELKTVVVKGPAIITTIFSSLRRAHFVTVDCVLNTAKPNERWFFRGMQAVLIGTRIPVPFLPLNLLTTELSVRYGYRYNC
jgi:hypothetical protein